jgi:hypothetical protein
MPVMGKAATVLAVQRWLRQHPEAADQEVMETLGIHRFDADLIKVARENLAADQSERTDIAGGYRSWQP